MWCHVLCEVDTNISEEHDTSIVKYDSTYALKLISVFIIIKSKNGSTLSTSQHQQKVLEGSCG